MLDPSQDAEVLLTAKDVLSDDLSRQNSMENLREESTMVEVLKTGKDGEPIEIVVKHSTITSQLSNDEDETEHTAHDSKSGSTRRNIRYRHKKEGFWSCDDGRIEGEQDGQLEVDVKEERCDEEGHHLVKKTWEAKWCVQKFEYLPEWLQDNEFLRHGHRPPLPSFAQCFKSILSVHTETGNIWTHLVGCVAFALIALRFMFQPDAYIRFQDKVIFSFFFAGAILCLGMSFTFHTVSCHSLAVARIFSKLDYMGISLLIVGSFIPWLYYGFYCRREPKVTYISMVTVLVVAVAIVSLWDKFSEPKYRHVRAIVFVAIGLSGLVPAIHFTITDGLMPLFSEAAFHWLMLMAFLYILGASLYATRTPERFFPGKCDIWFQSHQIFHVCVVAAALIHYYGISNMAMLRLKTSCDVESGAFNTFRNIYKGVRKAVHEAL